MPGSDQFDPRKLTRRDALKLSGLTLGGLAFGGVDLITGGAQAAEDCPDCSGVVCPDGPTCNWDSPAQAQRYSYFDQLPRFVPFSDSTATTIVPLRDDEMRITFMGSAIPPRTRAQNMMSIFVEVGWDPDTQLPLDQFVFDCGSGVCANYGAMNVGFGRMNKIFLTHLHGDHMSDLTHIYCFGPSADRKSPLFVWGPGPSGVKNPNYNPADPSGGPEYYEDGTRVFCERLRAACRWHTESFSFQTTSYRAYVPPTREDWGLPCDPVPVDHDRADDGYAMIPIELAFDWDNPTERVAYDNPPPGVKITAYPVIHDRQGSIAYKLEWNGLSMIFTGDTKPEWLTVEQARNGNRGVDVLIHEMVPPAQVWAMKSTNSDTLPSLTDPSVLNMQTVQNSSHSPQGAFGYFLSQIQPRPRLTVATHFPTADDTVACAMQSVEEHCLVYQGNLPTWADQVRNAARITWSFDLMVISVTPDRITEQQGYVQDFGFSATYQPPPGTKGNPDGFNTPKYHKPGETGGPAGDAYAQINTATQICACNPDGTCNYREDGY